MAISVTVIATGFEEKRKPKGLTTVKLEEDIDTVLESDIEVDDEKQIMDSNNSENLQQTLSLDDDVNLEKPEEEPVLDPVEEKLIEPEVVNSKSQDESIIDLVEEELIDTVSPNSKIVVLDLEDEDQNNAVESMDDEIIPMTLDEESISEPPTISSDLDDKPVSDSRLNSIDAAQVNHEEMKVESREREDRLRNISMQLRTPSGLTSLEDVPAYKRNNIEISEPTHSSESEASSYTLTNGNNNTTELKKNNSFLHDNVD